jgi:hypothetical protein
MSFTRTLRRQSGVALVGLCLLVLPGAGRADELADFRAAVAEASANYRVAMTTLQTRGREETSAAVHRFRESWQALVDRFGKSRPASIADDEQFSATVTLTDARLVGALIVIDIGSREAAQSALAPIAETLADLDARAAPR